MSERYKSILLIGLILFFLSSIYLYQGYNHNVSLVNQVIKVTEDKLDSAVDLVQDFSYAPYSARIKSFLSTNPDIAAAFANRDRELLYQLTLPKYKALIAENTFFQVMRFHLPDGTTFLRMQNPDLWGDDLTKIRSIVTAVHRDRKLYTGYEIGRHGVYYRIVYPFFYNDDYVGALEFGIRVDELLEVLKKKINVHVTSFFLKDLLWKTTHFHDSSSIQYGEYCLITHDQEIYSQLPDTLDLNKQDQRVVLGNQTFIVHSHPLFKNYQGTPVGGIIILQNITPLLKQKKHFLLQSGGLVLFLSGTTFIILYFGFGRIMGSLHDEIANREKAQKATSMAKKEWERTVDAVPDFISILDKDFRIIRTNKALPEALELPMNEVLGSHCYQIFCNKEKVPEGCPYRTFLRDKQISNNEIYFEKLQYYYDVILSPLHDENDEFIGAVQVARNISHRKAIEQRAEENYLYLQSILEASTNTAIIATDDTLQIKYCNFEVERLLGYPADMLINRSIQEVHVRDGIEASAKFDKAMDQVRQHGLYQFQLQHGNYILDTQISSLTDKKGNFSGVLFIGRDVTAQKHAEKKLRKAEKFKAIGLVAGGVAHDLNNVLSGVISYPELLRLQLPKDSDMQEPLVRIQKAGQRAAAIVADLLTMARGVAHQKELLSLNDLILEYFDSPEYRKLSSLYPNVTVNTQLGQDCWNCRCSPTHIMKLLMNLVTNAIEAIVDTGSIFITTYNQTGKPQQAGDAIKDDEFVVLQVRDTGSGISENDLEHIFEPFYSTKKMGRSGSGLGLSVVWNTVKEHGGLVTVDSDKSGTNFTLYLPACNEQIDRDHNESTINLQHLKGQGTILVVDDDKEQRIISQQMLSALGYTVHTVKSGEEAVAWFQENSAELLVLDMIMGSGMNGRETYEQVIRLYPKQKALVVSGLAKDNEMENALQLGVSGFLSKPYSLKELGIGVKQAMKS